MEHILSMNDPDLIGICQDCPPPVRQVTIIDSDPHEAEWQPAWRVEKYDGDWTPEQIAAGLAGGPSEVVQVAGNVLTTVGIVRMLNLLKGTVAQAADNTHTFMGVGDSSTAAAAGQTDLQAATGATHRQWNAMDATYPQLSGTSLIFRSTFATTEANFAWNEVAIELDDGVVSPGTAALSTGTQKMFNRKVVSAGTKTSAQTWVATLTVTIT